MPSPAAIRAAQALVQVDRAPGDQRVVSIAGSYVDCGRFPMGVDAEHAADRILRPIFVAIRDFLRAVRPTGLAVETAFAAASSLVLIEAAAGQFDVTVCGELLPGPEDLGAAIARRRRLGHWLACALDQALGELVARETFSDGDSAPPATQRDEEARTIARLRAERRAALARISELEAENSSLRSYIVETR